MPFTFLFLLSDGLTFSHRYDISTGDVLYPFILLIFIGDIFSRLLLFPYSFIYLLFSFSLFQQLLFFSFCLYLSFYFSLDLDFDLDFEFDSDLFVFNVRFVFILFFYLDRDGGSLFLLFLVFGYFLYCKMFLTYIIFLRFY